MKKLSVDKVTFRGDLNFWSKSLYRVSTLSVWC